ncbi:MULTISPECIES: acyltransferase [Aliivibrio]|uniref:Fucose 4-O-acetylase n=1 Tax=Aliivibrio finisterrensis TaxID=511998 RepID=A0A4Q5KWU0_9GAMM|nr:MULTISPECIES: acyltransferase family protein [Aliivibrio]MDD9178528.1 acyltransferase family protein [Aliivibrio sp. A6]RYU53023.1 fucose 4-O-acetylase [Aliivibrio finisterrensis]RYU53419.1 fucose 4-O-acetylase [Aliivibrio finisterrensis]RYU58506.1 fucose 4-O-acetylase [Aliivibrio finisterrensis]RYU65925.1 fucose 4-O-acetylase [Aliivibrio finisterrensis]
MENSQKIASLELGRLVAMFAIIALHSQVFMTYLLMDDTPVFGYAFNQFTRFAVPFFFILSGYFIQPKLMHDPLKTIQSYCAPLLKIWIVWSALSLALPFNWKKVAENGYLAERTGYWNWLTQNPLNALFEGGMVHLWFIPALIIAVSITGLLIHFKKTTWLIPIAMILYVYGLAGGSYQTLTEVWTPFFTRNGPFFSTLMVAIGFELRRRNITLSSTKSMLLLVTGFVIHFSEAYWLTQFDVPFNLHDFLIGTPLMGIGMFFLLLSKPRLGHHPITFTLSKHVLGIYVCHLLFVVVFLNITGMMGLTLALRDFLIVFGTAGASTLFVLAINRTPLRRLLFR